jgi:hypothetical protein
VSAGDLQDDLGTDILTFGVGGPQDNSPLRFVSEDMLKRYRETVAHQRRLAQQQLFYCDQLDKLLGQAQRPHVQD